MTFPKIDLKKIVNESVKKATQEKGLIDVNEAFVAQPKSYSQTSDLISEKTKTTHAELYQNYVVSFNQVSSELDSVDKSNTDSRHNKFRSLKLDEVYNLNAVWLHELFFANAFNPQSELFMDSLAFIKLQRDFGSFQDWQKDFMACAKSCGNGWVVCGYNLYLKKYVNTIVSNNSQDVMMGLFPLIVLDLHEHSYYRDFLNDKQSYIVARMRELDWQVLEQRFQKASKIEEALR